jgi:hypothetical protein
MDEEELEHLGRDLDEGETGLSRPNSWRIIIIVIVIIISISISISILSKMPVNTTGYYNHAFCCDIFYHFFLFIIETTELISSVGVLPSGCAVLWFVLDAQLFLRPQLISQRAQSLTAVVFCSPDITSDILWRF